MSLPAEFPLPVPLLALHLASRHQPAATSHKRDVALLEAARLRRLERVPEAFVAYSRLIPTPLPPPINFSQTARQQMLSNPSEFLAAATVTVAEFTWLHAHIAQHVRAPGTHPKSTSEHSHSMPTRLTTADQLLLWLIYCCGVRTAQLMMQFNHLHRTTIPHYIDHVTTCIIEALAEQIEWPSSDERQQLHGKLSECHDAVAVLGHGTP